MTRHELREHVFLLVFRMAFHSYEDMPEQVRLHFEELPEEMAEPSDDDEEYIQKKSSAVFEKIAELDAAINEKAENWNTDRIGKVELAIIRLALYEIKYDEDVPESVAINEAVELAKKYGQDGASGFVNGVLAKLIK